jgi:hypothetical protein
MNNSNLSYFNNNSLKLLTLFVSGLSVSYFIGKIRQFFNRKYKEKRILKMGDNEVLREQLKRNYEFFGEDGMNKIKSKFVVVVGIGGVGR